MGGWLKKKDIGGEHSVGYVSRHWATLVCARQSWCEYGVSLCVRWCGGNRAFVTTAALLHVTLHRAWDCAGSRAGSRGAKKCFCL